MTPKENAVYEDEHTGNKMVCVHSPKTAGVPTHRAENKQIEFETVEDGEWFSISVDNFGRNYRKVADSEDELAEQDEGVDEDEIYERRRESWSRLASEFGITEDEVREIVVSR